MRRYKVQYERDEAGWWVATTTVVPRALISRNRFMVDAVRLPVAVRRTVARFQLARTRAEREQARARVAARAAVNALRQQLKVSVRDAGALLGLSHQRVQQIG